MKVRVNSIHAWWCQKHDQKLHLLYRMEHKTKELLAGTTLPSSDLELYKPPNSATFTLTQGELDAVLPKVVPGKRMRLTNNWTSVFREHLLRVTPYTTWNFIDSSVSSPHSRKATAPLFKAHGTCVEQYCNAQIECLATKDKPLQVRCTFKGMVITFLDFTLISSAKS